MLTRLQPYWIKKYGYDILQIALNVLLFVFGLATCISLGTIYNYFGSECILFANLNLRLTTNSSVKINNQNSIWGSQDVCDFTTYVAAVSVVHAFIWTWFFLHMRSSQHSKGYTRYMTLPVLVTYAGLFLCTFVSSAMITAGINNWCSYTEKMLKFRFSCAAMEDLRWNVMPIKKPFYTYLKVAEVASWLQSFANLGQCVLICVKAYRDDSYDWTMLSEKEDDADDNIGSYDGSHLIDDVTGSTIFTDDSIDNSVVCYDNILCDHDKEAKTISTTEDVEGKNTPHVLI